MNYEQRYEEALERAKDMLSYKEVRREDMEYLFPELKESEDERVRKEIIKLVKFYYGSSLICKHTISKDKMVAWLEKQSETFTKRDVDDAYLKGISDCKHEMDKQNKAVKEEVAFHKGDWVVWDNKISCRVDNIYQGKETLMYTITDTNNMTRSYSVKGFDNNANLWTIEDANDGDVLCLGGVIAIFKKYIGQEKCICYCSFCDNGGFEIPIENGEDNVYGCTDTTPATQEERDLLFAKMHEAGYEWDTNKKELIKL